MSFFNNKEEVLDIRLTPFGKRKIIEGKFNPVYYSAFDDDIVYDTLSYNVASNQNDIEERILNNSLYLKNQTFFSSSSTNPNEVADFSNYFGFSLADTDDSNEYLPAFEISFLEGEIDNVNLQDDNRHSKFGSEYIPQINLREQYIDIVIDRKTKIEDLKENQLSYFGKTKDGSHVWLQIRNYIFNITEHNVELFNKNFDVEVIKIEDDVAEKLNYDNFVGTEDGIIENGLLLDTPGGVSVPTFLDFEQDGLEFTRKDLSNISSYFDFYLDREEKDYTANRLFIYGDKGFGRGTPPGEEECEPVTE